MSKRTGQKILITAKEMARWESIMKKLDNEIKKQKEEQKKKGKKDNESES